MGKRRMNQVSVSLWVEPFNSDSSRLLRESIYTGSPGICFVLCFMLNKASVSSQRRVPHA